MDLRRQSLYHRWLGSSSTFPVNPAWCRLFNLPKFGLEFGFLVPNILMIMPFTFWIREMVPKLIDEPSVKFTRELYKKTLAPGRFEICIEQIFGIESIPIYLGLIHPA
jgi:hypothetical protein